MERELSPLGWALIVAYVMAMVWLLGGWRDVATVAPRRMPRVVRHPAGRPLRLIIGAPGTAEHVVHVWASD